MGWKDDLIYNRNNLYTKKGNGNSSESVQTSEPTSGWKEDLLYNRDNLYTKKGSADSDVSEPKFTVTTTRKTGTVKYSQEGYDKKIKELESQQKALETKLGASAFQNITDKKTYNELNDIKAQISKLQNEKYLSDNYSDITKNTDFKELSLPKTRSAWETDSRYKAVNNIGNWQDLLEQSDTHSEEENYKYMTDEERGIFNYLYNTQGEKTANDYLDRLEYELNDRGMEQLVLDYQEYAREHPVASTVGASFTNLFGGAVGTADVIGQNIANVGRRIMGEETVPIDYNTPAQQGTVMTNTIRSTIAGDLNNNYGTLNENIPIVGGLGLGDVYQLGTSMIDSTAVALTAGSAGTALLGSAAASSAMQDAAERGLSDRQVLFTGISSGIAEALFEKVSIENLLSPKNGATIGQAIKNTLKQAGVEASEETFTTIANTVTDNIINGNKSEFSQSVEQYKQEGMSESAAKKQAAKDWIQGLFIDALGGFISGGVMGGGYEAITRASYNSAGKRILNDSSSLDSLRAAANETGVSLSENPTYKEAGRALRSIDFNRATGNISDNTATETTGAIQQSDDLQQREAKQEQSSKTMLRATYSTEDGRYIDSDITGIKNGEIQFSDNTTHNLSDVYINDSEMASVVRYALENEKIGNTIITAYNSGILDGAGQNATDFISQFENAIEYGKVGAKLDYVKNSEAVNTLTPTQIEMAYYIGSGQSASAVSKSSVKAETNAQELKVDSQKQAQADRLSKTVGRDIVFYESQNTSENGFYNPKDGKIYVNTNSKNPLPQIVSHELTHSIELSRSYGELSRIIFNKLKKSGSDIEQMRQQKKDLYSRNGIELQDETAIDQEIVAEYIEKNLLTDEKSINEFVRENRSLGEKILNWINSVLAKLGNKKAQEREFLTRVRDLYSKALKDVEMDRNTKIDEYYINPDFESQFDEWMKLSESERAASNGRFLIGTTSDALKSIGVKNYRIYWDKGALAAKMRKHEELTPDIIKQLPNIIENPVLVLKSETVENSITVWGEIYDRKTNNPIMVAIKLNAKTKTGVVSNFAVITSAYKRPISQLQNFLNKAENILYLDDNKKRTNDWLQSLGLQLPPLVHQYGSIHTISQQDDSVKGYSLNNLKFPLKETEVDSRKNVKYNIDSIGGEENGRSGEVRNYRNGYEEKENTSRQIGLGTETGRKTGRDGKESGAPRRGSSNVYSKDSEGRRISTETANRLNGTAIVDDNGNPIAVYHSTPNMDFTEFAVGDIGFHFGNENQAENRLKGKGTKGRFIKSYLNIKNPIEFKYDLPDWNASAVAIHLWNDGIISFDEYLQVHKLYLEDKDNYNSKSSTELRKILAEKDYDGIVYENEIEGEGKSYIAFYPEQVVIFDDGKGKKTQFSISETYKKEIDEWNSNGRKDNEKFILGTTSDIIQGLGAIENDIYIKSEKINTIFEEHPEMTIEEIKKIPEILEYPVMILKSKNKNRGQKNNTRIVVLGKVTAKNGLPVIGVLDLRPFENGSVVDDMQKINSTYTKKNTLNFLEDSEVLYADKKRTASLLKSVGLQLRPTELQRVGSIGSISYNKRSVNIVGVPFNDLFIRDSESQYSVSDDEIRNLNTQEEKLTTELSEMEQQYLVAQIEQGKKDAKVLRSEKDKLRKQIESLEKRSTRKAKTQLKQYQRNLDKMADRIAYKDEQLKALKQNKNDAVLAARIAEGRVWSEKYGKDISELQEKISRKNVELQEVRKKRDQMLAEKTESFKRYKGERRKTVLRGQIKSLVNDFNARLDRPNQKHYIPEELIDAVIDLTSAINISNDSNSPKIQAQMEHMKVVYDRYKNDPKNTVYDDLVSQMIDQVTKEIGNTPLRDMSENQLRMVYDTLTAFSRAVTDAQRFAAFEYDKAIYLAGTDAINEIRTSKLKFKNKGINNFVNWLLTPERFFNRLGGYRKNGIWEKVGKSLNESTQKAIGISREFYYTFREFSESNYADELADQKKLYDVGLKTEDGNHIKITKGQMISIYMHLTSADNRRAIQYGGLSIPDMNDYYKGRTKASFGEDKKRTVGLSQEMQTLRDDYTSAQRELQKLFTKYTEDGEVQYNSINEIDMQMIEQYQKNIEAIEAQMETAAKKSEEYIAGIEENINKFLTDEDKKFIKTLRSWYKYSADKINEVTMRMYGIKRATVDNYYTIRRDPAWVGKDSYDFIQTDYSLENVGFLKERVPSLNPVLLTDVMFDVSSHASGVAKYYGYVEMMRDYNRLIKVRSGNTTVLEAINTKLGPAIEKDEKGPLIGVTGGQYIANLMADIVGSRTRQNSLFSILRRNVTRSALTVNIRVGFSQLSGTLSAPAEVGWSATLKGMGKGAVKALSPKYKEHLAAINEFYYERYKGEGGMREFSDIKVADNALDRIWNKIDDKTKGYLLNWSRSVDAYSTAVMYSMAEAYVQDTLQIKPGDAAYLDEVNKKFTNILIHTQPQGAATQRADLFRDPREGYSFVTLFKSQSNQFFNLLYDASARVWTYQNAIKNGDSTVTQEDLYMAKRDLANAATTVILGGSLGYAVTRFIANAILRHMDDYRDEDDEVTAQSIALGIANDSISSFAGILPLGEEIYDLIMASITDRPYYGISEAGLQSLNDTFNGIVSFSGDVKDNEVTLESFTKLIKAAAPMLMIPYNSINTIIEAAKGYINDIPSGNFLTFEYGAERNNTTQGKRMYEAIIEGDTEKYNSVRDEMIEDNIAKGKSRDDAESAVRSALKSTLKDKFLEGEITSSDANEILVSHIYNGEETAVDDAYWTLQEWQSGNPEYSKYGDLKEAVIKADGTEFKQAKAELIEHGVKESSIRSEITKAVKDAYLNGELSLNEAKNKLILYNGLSASEAFDKIKEWKKEAK